MDTIFMNFRKQQNFCISFLVLKLTNKLDLRRGQKSVALSNLSIFYTWKNIKSSYNHNKFIISAPTWSDEFQLPDGSYSISDIQDCFRYIRKNHSEDVDNLLVRIYVNKIENRITFKIKNGYYRELLTLETMKLLGSTKSKITEDKNGENVPHLEIAKLVLVHCNLVNNDYQQHSRILYLFVPNKPFRSLRTNHIFLKTFNSEFQEISIWFTDVLNTTYDGDRSDLEKKISHADKKIPDTNDLLKKKLNAKITEIENKIPSITGLVTKSALTAVENKIPNVSSLGKKRDYDTKISDIEKFLIIILTNTLLLQNLII